MCYMIRSLHRRLEVLSARGLQLVTPTLSRLQQRIRDALDNWGVPASSSTEMEASTPLIDMESGEAANMITTSNMTTTTTKEMQEGSDAAESQLWASGSEAALVVAVTHPPAAAKCDVGVAAVPLLHAITHPALLLHPTTPSTALCYEGVDAHDLAAHFALQLAHTRRSSMLSHPPSSSRYSPPEPLPPHTSLAHLPLRLPRSLGCLPGHEAEVCPAMKRKSSQRRRHGRRQRRIPGPPAEAL